MMAIHEGLNPPFPESVEDLLENSQKGFGSRLLNTVRRLEKILGSQSSDDETENTIDNAVSLFNQLISLFSRRGMLHGNKDRADKILSSLKTSAKTKRPKANKSNKQKNKGLSMELSNDDESTNSSGYEQEALVFTAILRVFNMDNNGEDSIFPNDRNLIVALTAELCVAISQFVQKSNPSDACCQAEYELILQTGKPLLAGLLNAMRSLKSDVQAHTKEVTGTKASPQCLTLAHLDADRHIEPLISCLKATSSLVSLFGTKLSRSTQLLSDLRQISWTFLTINDSAVQTSAARLLATLPVAGGTDRTSTSDLWNQAIEDVVDLLARSTKAMAPLTSTNKKKDDSNLSDECRTAYQLWWKFVKEDLSDEMDRTLSFRCFLFGLTRCFQSLLLLDGIAHEVNSPILNGAHINVDNILDVVEAFVTFPLSAETLLYKTKKRLRNESIDGGLLSPRIASTVLGNDLKTFGHKLLDTLLQCVGGSTLMPFSTRITRISYASLLTSCSGALRKALDPTRSGADSKKRKWLHQSVALRTVAITTLAGSISMFGIGKKEKSATSNRPSRSEAEKAVDFVAGCFLEEVKRGSAASGFQDESWGSNSERVDLIVAALDCLRTVLVACGGFLDISTRSLVDSTVLAGLVEIEKENKLLSSPAATIGMLDLSSCSITTPWKDGSMTSLHDSIVMVARRCENNVNVDVCKSAKSLLMVCNTVSVPRAPALLYVSRATANLQHQEPTPERAAADLVNDLEKARAEIVRAQRTEEELKKKKAEDKRRRQDQEAEENLRKRKKVEAAVQQKQDTTKPITSKRPSKKDPIVDPKTEEKEAEPMQQANPLIEEEKSESSEPASSQQDDTNVKDCSHDTPPSSDKEDAPMEDAAADDDDFDFPEIVEGGGPDSDDE